MRLNKLLATALAASITLGLVACDSGVSNKPADGSKETQTEQKDAKKPDDNGGKKELNIDVILKTTASEYWGYVQAGALAYSKEHPEVKVNVVGASSETAFDEQLALIETDLASGKYDAFVMAPLQADMVASKIANVEKPVIAVDTKIDSPKVLSFVGTGNAAAGKLGGAEAVKAAKAAGWKEIKAICISGVQGDTTAADRMEGYKQGVEAEGGEFLAGETQYADAVADKAVACMEGIMQTHPEGISIIACNNDDIAMAAARAAKGNPKYEKTIFLGFDGIISACDAILKGDETMSVAQEGYSMGYKSVEAAVKAIDGEKIEKFIDSGASIVTKANAADRKKTLEGYLNK